MRRALAPLVGTSLLALDGRALERRAEALPTVVSVSYDRAFPHTLRIDGRARAPGRCAPPRQGDLARLGAGEGRPAHPDRHRIPRSRGSGCRARRTSRVGAFLAPRGGGTAARTLALAARFPARIATASLAHGELVFRLRSGLELRLGDPTDVRLKLAIARRALAQLPTGATYVDVSVPGRPVAGVGQPSTLK